MAQVPQSFANHGRFDPPFHFFVVPVAGINFLVTLVYLFRSPSVLSAPIRSPLRSSASLRRRAFRTRWRKTSSRR